MPEKTIVLTDANFKSHIEKGIVLVDFWASWCAPCRMITPIIEDIAEKYQGSIKVGKLNVDENQDTAANFGIASIPTLIIFKDAREEARIVGAVSKEKIEQSIESLLK